MLSHTSITATHLYYKCTPSQWQPVCDHIRPSRRRITRLAHSIPAAQYAQGVDIQRGVYRAYVHFGILHSRNTGTEGERCPHGTRKAGARIGLESSALIGAVVI
jgi:hypothetical protein